MSTPATRLQVTQAPNEEDRFWVQSGSRRDVKHLVDMNFEGGPACGCEDFFCKKTRPDSCKHIDAVRALTSPYPITPRTNLRQWYDFKTKIRIGRNRSHRAALG